MKAGVSVGELHALARDEVQAYAEARLVGASLLLLAEMRVSAGLRSTPASLLHLEAVVHWLARIRCLPDLRRVEKIIAVVRHADAGDTACERDPPILVRRPGRDSPAQCFLRVWTSSA